MHISLSGFRQYILLKHIKFFLNSKDCNHTNCKVGGNKREKNSRCLHKDGLAFRLLNKYLYPFTVNILNPYVIVPDVTNFILGYSKF